MRRFTKLGWGLAGAIALVVMLAPDHAGAEGKIGYIDSYRIRNEFEEFKVAQETYNADVEQWQIELDSIRLAVIELEEDYQQKRLILSDEARTRKETELKQATEGFQRKTQEVFGPGGRAEKRNAELVKPILDKINGVLEQLAIEQDYDYIFDAVEGNIAYAKSNLDLTDRVLEELRALN